MDQRGRFRGQTSKPEELEEVELATGPAPVFEPEALDFELEAAAAVADKPVTRGPEIDWKNPGPDVLEQARLAAESWGEGAEARWDQAVQQDWTEEQYGRMLPRKFIKRRKETAAPRAVKDHIVQHMLGYIKWRRLPKGEHRPKQFSGSDPAHNGLWDSVDDGSDSTLGRMANAIHKGFMRQRATSPCAGLPGRPGEFPQALRPEIAFIGRSNVGKSSLMNAITRTQKLADAEDREGVTRFINWYTCSRLPVDILDLPGYGPAAGADFGGLLTDFVCTRRALRALYVLIDARCGLKPSDWNFLSMLGNEGPDKIFVMTKCDMVDPWNLAKVATMVLEDIEGLPNCGQRLLMVSAKNGAGMHELRHDISGRAIAWAKRARMRAERVAAAKARREEAA